LPARRTAFVLALLAACSGHAPAAGVRAAGSVVGTESARTWHCGQVEMIVGGAGVSPAGSCAPAFPATAAVPAVADAGIRPDRIAISTQVERDGERRAILERELRGEEARLARLGSPGTAESPERAAERLRIRDDIDALHRELARLR
jgi:hypothetical protein